MKFTNMVLQHPSFKSLFNDYLAAVNERDIDKVLSFLSPSCSTVTPEGHVVVSSAEGARAGYIAIWNKGSPPIVIKEIEEFEDGVKAVLEHAGGEKFTTVRYYYAEEGGKWVQIKHVVWE
jgi:hypothetical protein